MTTVGKTAKFQNESLCIHVASHPHCISDGASLDIHRSCQRWRLPKVCSIAQFPSLARLNERIGITPRYLSAERLRPLTTLR
jgi:hypothetical protein